MRKALIQGFFTLCLFNGLSFTYSQNNPAYNLLWKIESNHPEKPSYLFGTMHVNDYRAFNFSDAVMQSIESCDIFATEVHPDSVTHALFNNIITHDTINPFKKVLNDERYNKLKEQFEEINGYDFEKLQSKNPMIVRSLLSSKNEDPKNKQTFVDAYLYGIAKTLRKKITGLERVKNQIDFFYSQTEEEQRRMILDILPDEFDTIHMIWDKMVEVYHQGNLENLRHFIGDEGFNSSIMSARNNEMAENLDELMSKHTVFAAIGAAHLIGDSSVIELLRHKGYKVSSVKANFTGIAEQYKIDPLKMKWELYKDEEMGYSVEMPGTPFPADQFSALSMVVYPDISCDVAYSVFTMDFRNSTLQKSDDEMIKTILNNFKENDRLKLISNQYIDKSGYLAIEFILAENNGKRQKVQLIIKNNILYGLTARGTKKQLEENYITYFFNSFKTHPLPPIKSKEWENFSDEKAAFSILLPDKPTEFTKEVPNPLAKQETPYLINFFMVSDKSTMTLYLIAYNDHPPGYYLEDRDFAFKNIQNELKNIGSLAKPIDTVWLDGIEGRQFDILTNEGYFIRGRVFIRGNRIYKLLKQNMLAGEKTLIEDDFMPSFSFTPYKNATLKSYEPKGENFAANQFSNSRIVIDSVSDFESIITTGTICYTTNPNSGGVYLVEHDDLSDFFYVQNIDTFYSEYIRNLKNWNDSIVRIDSINIDGNYGKEVLLENKHDKTLARFRFWIDNKKFYFISGHLGKDEIYSEVSNNFFNSFRKTAPNKFFDIYKSKTRQVLDGLLSADTAEYAKSFGALEFYDFTDDDLPLLTEAIFRTYSDDSAYNGARCKIIESIGYLKKEESLKTFQKLYKQINTSDNIKSKLLNTILQYDDDKSLALFLNLFMNTPPVSPSDTWQLFLPFNDSIELAYQYYDRLLLLFDNPSYRSDILNLSIGLAMSDNLLYIEKVKLNYDLLTREAMNDIETFKEKIKTDEYYYQPDLDNYLQLMQLIKGKEINDTFTKAFFEKEIPDYLKSSAISARIVNKLKSDKKEINRLLDSIEYRYTIMEAYDKIGLLMKVPEKYRSKEEIAKLSLRNYLIYEDDYPEEIKVTGTIGKTDSIVYVLKMTYKYDGEKEEYIGISGYFSENESNFRLSDISAVTNWEKYNEDWEKKAKELLPLLTE